MTIEIVGLGGYKVGFIWYTFISPPDLCYCFKIGIDTVPDVCFAGFCWV